MSLPVSAYVTLVEVLERTASWEEFEAAIQAGTRRLEAEGIDALAHLQFFAHPESVEVGAILTFADGNRFMEHIRMITQWEEFAVMLRVVKPLDVRVYGKLPEEAHAWLTQINVVSKIFEQHLAGFVR